MIDSLWQAFVYVHLYWPHAPKAILAGSLVSTVCGALGCFIVLRRTAFLADALAHAMLAGVVCGYLLMKVAFGVSASAPAMLIGSLIAGLLTVAMVAFISRSSRVKEDAIIGVVYTGVFALGGVLLSLFSRYVHVDLLHFVSGQLLTVQASDLWMMAAVSTTVFGVMILFFRQLQLVSFDPVMAASIGVPVAAVELLLTTCTSLVVVSGVNIVGVILVVGLLIIPASTAYLLCDRLDRMLILAALFGWTSFGIGYAAAELLNVAPGSAVVLASALQFAVVFVGAPRYGWLADVRRRRLAAPQKTIEEILRRLPRLNPSQATVEERAKLCGGAGPVRRAVRNFERREWIRGAGGAISLTEAGEREALRLIRAHRLWETYLERLGEPAAALHSQAQRLEHIYDEEAVDYLDDQLGHPILDPHGSEIPEDFMHLAPGGEVPASLLRTGRRARVVRIEERLRGALDESAKEALGKIAPGEVLEAAPRRDEGASWVFVLPDLREIVLNHAAADALIVRIEEPPHLQARSVSE